MADEEVPKPRRRRRSPAQIAAEKERADKILTEPAPPAPTGPVKHSRTGARGLGLTG